MTPVPDSTSAAGATNTPNLDPCPTEGAEGLRSGLRASSPMDAVEALAAILEPEAFDPDQAADERWREPTKQRAIAHAARVITAGYRRVLEEASEEDARLLSEALHCAGSRQATHWPTVAGLLADEVYRLRAAVRALREET